MAIRIIDIPDNVYKDIKAYNQIPCADNYTVAKAILNSEALPDNATNGDVIKALFPNATIEIMKSNVEKTMVCVTWNFKDIPSYYNRFYEAWWNAPYAKEKNNDKI